MVIKAFLRQHMLLVEIEHTHSDESHLVFQAVNELRDQRFFI
jgi:protein tyrosine phosphatase